MTLVASTTTGRAASSRDASVHLYLPQHDPVKPMHVISSDVKLSNLRHDR
jgi:hypothetical protein